jgi:hypothetical protein
MEWSMRYPLVAFLFVFVIPPFTAHALLAGKARIAPATTSITSAAPAGEPRSHSWTIQSVR